MQNADLENSFQLIVAIGKLASTYHNASVEKMDHIFFRGGKVAFKPELLDFLKSRPCNEVITNEEWARLLTGMGYDAEQINDFDSIELRVGQETLREQLTKYAQRFPLHSLYAAFDALLKNSTQDPTFSVLASAFDAPEASVHGLFSIAYHYLDTMTPFEMQLNLLTDFYEPHFDHSRNKADYAGSAKILGQLEEVIEDLSTSISEAASQYVLLRARQLRQYADLDMSNPIIAASLQNFHAKLRAEVALLEGIDEKTNISEKKKVLLSMAKPEIEWLENTIMRLEISDQPNERQKGAAIRAAYLKIPYEQRALIVPEMQKKDLNAASPIGCLKIALDASTSSFPMFDFLTDKSQYNLSRDFKSRYQRSRSNSGDTLSETDSDRSSPDL